MKKKWFYVIENNLSSFKPLGGAACAFYKNVGYLDGNKSNRGRPSKNRV